MSTDFKENTLIRVVRYEQYPADEPTSFAVGFTVSIPANNKSIYRDTCVPFSQATDKSDSEIVALAWEDVKQTVGEWYESHKSASALVGSIFTPVVPAPVDAPVV